MVIKKKNNNKKYRSIDDESNRKRDDAHQWQCYCHGGTLNTYTSNLTFVAALFTFTCCAFKKKKYIKKIIV